jgi:hypothetical protein
LRERAFEPGAGGPGGSVAGQELADARLPLSHLIFEGRLERLPGLKICAAYGGRYLPNARETRKLFAQPRQVNRSIRLATGLSQINAMRSPRPAATCPPTAFQLVFSWAPGNRR